MGVVVKNGKLLSWAVSLSVTVAAMVAAPQAAKAETVADAMASAYRHSGLIDQNRALLRAADEDVAQAVAGLRPILNWVASVERSRGRAASSSTGFTSVGSASTKGTLAISLDFLLYDFGRSKLQVDIAKETVLATRQSLVSVEQQVLFRAAAAFFELRRAHAFVQLRGNNVRVITQELRAARDRFEAGAVTRTDVSLAEARLAGARASLAASQGQLAQAIEEFRAAVGRRPGRLSQPARLRQAAKSVQSAKAIALRTHPDMIAARHQVTAAELGVAVARAAVKPTVKLKGSYGLSQTYSSQAYSNGGSVSIEASGPVYQGGRLSSLARQAAARKDAARGGLHVARHGVAQNVGNAWALVQVARASREASERQVRASQVAFRGVREEAKAGVRTTLDVLDAEQELLDARANLISAGIDEQVAAYRLMASMGLLTAERLRLNVPRFDPAAYYNMVKSAPTSTSKRGKKLDQVIRALGKN